MGWRDLGLLLDLDDLNDAYDAREEARLQRADRRLEESGRRADAPPALKQLDRRDLDQSV